MTITLTREELFQLKQSMHANFTAAQNRFIETITPFIKKETQHLFKREVEQAVQAFKEEIVSQAKLLEL